MFAKKIYLGFTKYSDGSTASAAMTMTFFSVFVVISVNTQARTSVTHKKCSHMKFYASVKFYTGSSF